MSRPLIAAGLTLAAAVAMAAPAWAESFTTRIEPRAFYGAVVTVEEGVRVFRPLPPQRHVIVNPGGMTPLSLDFNDTRITEQSTSHNYFYDEGGGDRAFGVGVGGFGHGGFHKGRHGKGHHKGGSGPHNFGGGVH